MSKKSLHINVEKPPTIVSKEQELTVISKEAAYYKYALDQSSIVAITDIKGTIEYINEMFCTISKYSEEELIGQNQSIVNSGYHSKAFWKEMWVTIGKGDVWQREIKNKAKGGAYYWVDTTIVPFLNDKGKVERYLAIRHDITDKKQKESELEDALKEISDYKYSLDLSALVAVTDSKGAIQYVNEMFCKVSKYPVNELIGKNHNIVNSGYHPKTFWKEMWATIGRGEVWHNEVKNKAKDGTYYWVDTTIVPFLSEKGKPERYLAIRHDITDRKQKDFELANYHKELEQTNENLEKFAYTAAHDMKTPLSSASGLVHLIELELRGKDENKEIANYLNLLKDTLDRSKQLIGGILEYSKTSLVKMEMEWLDLGKLIAKSAGQYGTNEQVVIHIDEGMPTVLFYKTALTQIVDNLLSNAVKFNDKERCEIYFACLEKESCFEVSISDNGTGIAEENREKVFDLFENLKSSNKESSGIGLATVKKILLETNGKIWAETSKSQGAKFVFTINKMGE